MSVRKCASAHFLRLSLSPSRGDAVRWCEQGRATHSFPDPTGDPLNSFEMSPGLEDSVVS